MSEKFDQIVASLPLETYAAPIAPWKVDVLPKGIGGVSEPVVRMTSYRVMQSGPDEPRVFHELVQVFTRDQALELIDALEQALVFIGPPSPPAPARTDTRP